MAQLLTYSPGQVATIYISVLNTDGYYTDGYYDGYTIDGYSVPVIHRVVKPNHLLMDGYPSPMTRFDLGIFYGYVSIPSGASSVGSYYVDVRYRDDVGQLKIESVILQVTAPYGIYSVISS